MGGVAKVAGRTRSRRAEGRQVLGKSEQTKQRILDAAALEFAENGYSMGRLQAIADRVGIRLAALYYHFDTKESLVAAMLGASTKGSAQEVHAALEALPPGTRAIVQLQTAIKTYVSSILSQDAYVRAYLQVMRQAPASVKSQTAEITRAESATWKELLEAAQKEGDIRPDLDLRMARMTLLGAMNFSIEWFRQGPLTAADFAEELIKIVLEGMMPRH